MLGKYIEVRRPISMDDQLTIAEMQARTARVVGTHVESPLRLDRIPGVGVHSLDRQVIAKGLARLSLNTTNIGMQRFAHQLTAVLPESAHEPVKDIPIMFTRFVGHGALRAVGVAFYNATLDAEAVALNFAFDRLTGMSPPIPRHQYLKFGVVGNEDVPEVEAALDEWISNNQPTISLQPMAVNVRRYSFQAAS